MLFLLKIILRFRKRPSRQIYKHQLTLSSKTCTLSRKTWYASNIVCIFDYSLMMVKKPPGHAPHVASSRDSDTCQFPLQVALRAWRSPVPPLPSRVAFRLASSMFSSMLVSSTGGRWGLQIPRPRLFPPGRLVGPARCFPWWLFPP